MNGLEVWVVACGVNESWAIRRSTARTHRTPDCMDGCAHTSDPTRHTQMISNTLQKRLMAVVQEKIELGNQV